MASAPRLVSAPLSTAVDLSVAKQHLRVFDDDNDEMIELLLNAATKHAERFTGLAFVDQTWDCYLDAFPWGDIATLKGPLIEIVEVGYSTAVGAETLMAPDDVLAVIGSAPGRVARVASTWPTPACIGNAVRVRVRAGYIDNQDSPPSGTVPEDIQAAILLYLGTLYENRGNIVIGETVTQMPWASEQLLRPYRVLLGMA